MHVYVHKKWGQSEINQNQDNQAKPKNGNHAYSVCTSNKVKEANKLKLSILYHSGWYDRYLSYWLLNRYKQSP